MQNRKGWPYLIERASSSDRDTRQSAVIRAYSWLEHALEASGLSAKSRKSIADRLLMASERGSLDSGLSLQVLREAIRVRHVAAHGDSVPSSAVCTSAVASLSTAWSDLRRTYVTVGQALNLAAGIASAGGVSNVLLFGSLARSSTDPGDIDLLALDDGRYSSELEAKDSAGYQDATRITEHAIHALGLRDSTLAHASKCRWVDLHIFNGDRLGIDRAYTAEISMRQSDPNFFLNISRDALEHARNPERFERTKVPVFVSLRLVSSSLARLGFVGSRKTGQ